MHTANAATVRKLACEPVGMAWCYELICYIRGCVNFANSHIQSDFHRPTSYFPFSGRFPLLIPTDRHDISSTPVGHLHTNLPTDQPFPPLRSVASLKINRLARFFHPPSRSPSPNQPTVHSFSLFQSVQTSKSHQPTPIAHLKA